MVNLIFNFIAYGIGIIIKRCTQFEFNNSINFYSRPFSDIQNPGQIALRDRLLKKAGLKFVNNRIIINDEDKWKRISLLERVNIKLPPTTNSLESTHGQLNKKTPRKKNFWQSLYDIIINLNEKNQTINEHNKHNFCYEKRKTIEKLKNYNERMNQEIIFYSTTADYCNCSQNKVLSSLYNIDFPCIHRLHLGVNFPECPNIIIQLIKSIDELKIEEEYLNDDIKQINLSIKSQDKKHSIDIIRKFGKFRDTKKIEEYVYFNYFTRSNETFLNCRPTSLYEIIHHGILYFKNIQ